jgi:ubiquinol-cytochrome c reductase cytochrome b subunit
MKSLGLFFAVAAVLCLLGGLFQINPVWLYGPYHASQVSSPAQPDWYMGWLEGALRMFPPWEVRAFGFELPNPFFPAVLLAGLTFMGLYLWPFLEAWATGDRSEHHLLERPRDHPFRSALGAATLSFYVVLFFAASNDLVAKWLKVRVTIITGIFQVAVFVVPAVVGLVTHRLLRALTRSGAPRFSEMPLTALRLRQGRRPA